MLTRVGLAVLTLCVVSPQLSNAQTPLSSDGAPDTTRLKGDSVSVPMLSWEHRPIVMAKVNGKGPYPFLVDTGCSFSAVLDEGLMKKLKLLPKQTTSGDRRLEDEEPIRLKTIIIGDATFSGVSALPSDIAGFMPSIPNSPMGILGLPLFRDCLLTFDYPNKQFIFETGRLPKKGKDILRCSIDSQYGSILAIKPTVAGIKMDVHIDTGSPGVLTLLDKWQKKLPLKGEPTKVGQASTPSGSADVSTAILDGTLQIGKHTFKDPQVDFADLGPMLDSDCGNIGSGLLKDFALTVDQKRHRLRWVRGAPESESKTVDRHLVKRKHDSPYRIGVVFRPDGAGWIIEKVASGGAGDEAGLQQGDVVTKVNGTEIDKMSDKKLGQTFGSPNPITLEVLRNGKTHKITLTPRRVAA